MMNKRKTSWLGLTKYALFVPIVAMLLLINNTRTFANVTVPESIPGINALISGGSNGSEPTSSTPQESSKTQQKKATNPVPPVPPSKETKKYAPPVPPKKNIVIVEVDGLFELTDVDKKPVFPGGDEGLVKYLSIGTTYPVEDAEKGISGKVIVRFIVNSEGKVIKPTVTKSVSPSCDREAIRMVKEMPKWTPGEKNGKPTSVYYNLPIFFQLSKASDPE